LAYYRELYPYVTIESIWSKGHFNAVALTNPAVTAGAITYTLTNPVKDGLVHDYRKWPGLNSRPRHWSQGPRVTERPAYFFRQKSDEWETATYQLTPPPMLRHDGDLERSVRDAERAVEREQVELQRRMQEAGRTFLGAKAVLRMDPFASPDRPRQRTSLTPHLAGAGDPETLAAAKHILRSFRQRYREAWKALKRGLDACFPAGTLLMRTRFGLECEPIPAIPWCTPRPT
ncbi:MAG: hypothetical protein MO852_15615, partial [Candidatus Devosia euplotis]|nr:hypothetical protein [Candidatus Devosia euplotis]